LCFVQLLEVFQWDLINFADLANAGQRASVLLALKTVLFSMHATSASDLKSLKRRDIFDFRHASREYVEMHNTLLLDLP
jgi:hypothetical protein